MNYSHTYRYILIYCILLTYLSTTGQENFVVGKIFNLDGTTSMGKIDHQEYQALSKRVSFMNENGMVTMFLPQELKGYEINGGPKFLSRDINGLTYFLQVLFEGRANLYTKRNIKGKNVYYLDKRDKPLQEIIFSQEIVIADKGNYLSSSQNHIGLLTLYMSDAPLTQEAIKEITPNHKSLVKLFKQYHEEVCPGEQCFIFVDKTPIALIHIEPVLTWVNYNHSNRLTDNNRSFVPGIYINIGLPRLSKTRYVRLGTFYGRANYLTKDRQEDNVDVLKVTAHMMYIAHKGIFRPKFSGGIDYIVPHQAGIGLMGGLNIHLNSKMAITTSYDYFAFKMFNYYKEYFTPNHLNIGFQMLMK
ncbi:MAG: hypothetical protein IPN86_15580 [Saprospiraceae bacterium]|nr:hypothetical protein [Saprospiraceae bacterium]